MVEFDKDKTAVRRGGIFMADMIIGGIITAGLLLYLIYSLIKAGEL